jgi:hypothetical protein
MPFMSKDDSRRLIVDTRISGGVVSPAMRTPDLIIGPRDNPQTLRWHLLRWRGWQLSLHKWCRSDEDRALHDHTGDSISLILNYGYIEKTPYAAHWRPAWRPIFRKAEAPHRIILDADSAPVWSLWLRWPPRREWGFHCPKGWRHWRDFCAERDYKASGTSTVGRGCD